MTLSPENLIGLLVATVALGAFYFFAGIFAYELSFAVLSGIRRRRRRQIADNFVTAGIDLTETDSRKTPRFPINSSDLLRTNLEFSVGMSVCTLGWYAIGTMFATVNRFVHYFSLPLSIATFVLLFVGIETLILRRRYQSSPGVIAWVSLVHLSITIAAVMVIVSIPNS